jgi:uncharacterized membrane protein YbhN (UPF0104 family)
MQAPRGHARQRTRRQRLSALWRRLRSPPVRRTASAALFALAAWLVWQQVASMSMHEFLRALAATAPAAVLASLALTAASYACLAATEWFALRALGAKLSYRAAARVAVPAYALTNSAGFSPATGTAFRLQLYGRMGVPATRAAAVALAAGTAVTLSGVVTAGLLMVLDPAAFGSAVHGPVWLAVALGLVLLTPGGLWFFAFTRRAPRWLGGGRPGLSRRDRALALAAGIGDWLFSSAALFVLLPHPQFAAFPTYLAAYTAGALLSAATGVPGGIGVFEAIVLALTRVMTQVHETAAALLLYRCTYSLGPLAIWGATALIAHWRRRRDRGARRP